MKTQQLQKACQQAAQTDVWTEPTNGLTSTVLDHAEEALRRCFEKTKEGGEREMRSVCKGQRYSNNPLAGLNAIFKKVDQNRSGKVDRHEFQSLCNILDFNGSQAPRHLLKASDLPGSYGGALQPL